MTDKNKLVKLLKEDFERFQQEYPIDTLQVEDLKSLLSEAIDDPDIFLTLNTYLGSKETLPFMPIKGNEKDLATLFSKCLALINQSSEQSQKILILVRKLSFWMLGMASGIKEDVIIDNKIAFEGLADIFDYYCQQNENDTDQEVTDFLDLLNTACPDLLNKLYLDKEAHQQYLSNIHIQIPINIDSIIGNNETKKVDSGELFLKVFNSFSENKIINDKLEKLSDFYNRDNDKKVTEIDLKILSLLQKGVLFENKDYELFVSKYQELIDSFASISLKEKALIDYAISSYLKGNGVLLPALMKQPSLEKIGEILENLNVIVNKDKVLRNSLIQYSKDVLNPSEPKASDDLEKTLRDFFNKKILPSFENDSFNPIKLFFTLKWGHSSSEKNEALLTEIFLTSKLSKSGKTTIKLAHSEKQKDFIISLLNELSAKEILKNLVFESISESLIDVTSKGYNYLSKIFVALISKNNKNLTDATVNLYAEKFGENWIKAVCSELVNYLKTVDVLPDFLVDDHYKTVINYAFEKEEEIIYKSEKAISFVERVSLINRLLNIKLTTPQLEYVVNTITTKLNEEYFLEALFNAKDIKNLKDTEKLKKIENLSKIENLKDTEKLEEIKKLKEEIEKLKEEIKNLENIENLKNIAIKYFNDDSFKVLIKLAIDGKVSLNINDIENCLNGEFKFNLSKIISDILKSDAYKGRFLKSDNLFSPLINRISNEECLILIRSNINNNDVVNKILEKKENLLKEEISIKALIALSIECKKFDLALTLITKAELKELSLENKLKEDFNHYVQSDSFKIKDLYETLRKTANLSDSLLSEILDNKSFIMLIEYYLKEQTRAKDDYEFIVKLIQAKPNLLDSKEFAEIIEKNTLSVEFINYVNNAFDKLKNSLQDRGWQSLIEFALNHQKFDLVEKIIENKPDLLNSEKKLTFSTVLEKNASLLGQLLRLNRHDLALKLLEKPESYWQLTHQSSQGNIPLYNMITYYEIYEKFLLEKPYWNRATLEPKLRESLKEELSKIVIEKLNEASSNVSILENALLEKISPTNIPSNHYPWIIEFAIKQNNLAVANKFYEAASEEGRKEIKFPKDYTLLHLAVEAGNSSLVDTILGKKHNEWMVNEVVEGVGTILDVALKSNNLPIFEKLLPLFEKHLLSFVDKANYPALVEWAIKNHRLDLVKTILEQASWLKEQPSSQALNYFSQNRTLLHLYLDASNHWDKERIDFIKAFVTDAENLWQLTQQDESGITPLMLMTAHPELLAWLLIDNKHSDLKKVIDNNKASIIEIFTNFGDSLLLLHDKETLFYFLSLPEIEALSTKLLDRSADSLPISELQKFYELKCKVDNVLKDSWQGKVKLLSEEKILNYIKLSLKIEKQWMEFRLSHHEEINASDSVEEKIEPIVHYIAQVMSLKNQWAFAIAEQKVLDFSKLPLTPDIKWYEIIKIFEDNRLLEKINKYSFDFSGADIGNINFENIDLKNYNLSNCRNIQKKNFINARNIPEENNLTGLEEARKVQEHTTYLAKTYLEKQLLLAGKADHKILLTSYNLAKIREDIAGGKSEKELKKQFQLYINEQKSIISHTNALLYSIKHKIFLEDGVEVTGLLKNTMESALKDLNQLNQLIEKNTSFPRKAAENILSYLNDLSVHMESNLSTIVDKKQRDITIPLLPNELNKLFSAPIHSKLKAMVSNKELSFPEEAKELITYKCRQLVLEAAEIPVEEQHSQEDERYKVLEASYKSLLPHTHDKTLFREDFSEQIDQYKKELTEKASKKLSPKEGFGIGLKADFDSAENKFLVTKVIENSVAYFAGLKEGDKIVSVRTAQSKDFEDFSVPSSKGAGAEHSDETILEHMNKVRGEIGKTHQLKIERNGEVIEITLKSQHIHWDLETVQNYEKMYEYKKKEKQVVAEILENLSKEPAAKEMLNAAELEKESEFKALVETMDPKVKENIKSIKQTSKALESQENSSKASKSNLYKKLKQKIRGEKIIEKEKTSKDALNEFSSTFVKQIEEEKNNAAQKKSDGTQKKW